MRAQIAAHRVGVGDRRQDARIPQVREPELGQVPVRLFDFELPVFQLHRQSMEVGADHPGRHDGILEGMRTVIAGTLVRFAVQAVARVAELTAQGAVD